MCRPPPPPPPPFFPPDSGCLQITVVTSSAASVFRKLCQEVGSLARWMEGDSSGWAARRVRRLSGRLTSSCSWHDRGWLSVSLTAPPVMSVTPGDTGSHVFWAGSQQFEALFIFYLEEEKEVKDILFHPGFYFFPSPYSAADLRAAHCHPDEASGRFSLQLVKLLWAEDELWQEATTSKKDVFFNI